MSGPKHIIFDCDRVLIDSEILANRVEAEYKTELGFPITVEEQIRSFTGLATNHPWVAEQLGRLPQDYLEKVDQRIKEVYERELAAIDGVVEILTRLSCPVCVASNSEPEWLEYKLNKVGLAHHFPSAVFSGRMVKQGKPEPDLFLYAAEKMGWKPEDCLVIEDSEAGVRAGLAAGMRVCGFVGGKHVLPGLAEKLLNLGADCVISDLRKIFRIWDLPQRFTD